MSAAILHGGCLCGSVRYQAEGPASMQYNCHCRDCQRMSGAAYLPIMGFPLAAVTFTGEVHWYHRHADSGRPAIEGFCPQCGARLFGQGDGVPGLMLIMVGTLDEPGLFTPTDNIYTRSAPAWDAMDPAIAQWPTDPLPTA